MDAKEGSSTQDLSGRQSVVITAVFGLGGFLGGLFLAGLGDPGDLLGVAVVLGSTLATLFALAEVDSVMRDDPYLRMIRLVATIVTSWGAMGVAVAGGVSWGWGMAAGALIGTYMAYRICRLEK